LCTVIRTTYCSPEFVHCYQNNLLLTWICALLSEQLTAHLNLCSVIRTTYCSPEFVHCYQNNLLLTWICAQGISIWTDLCSSNVYTRVYQNNLLLNWICAPSMLADRLTAYLNICARYVQDSPTAHLNPCTRYIRAGLTAHLNLCPRSHQNRCSSQFVHNVYSHDRLITYLSSCTRCDVMRAPEAPTGCPSAMAPPLTFNFSKSSFSSFWQARVWAPNASLICNATSFILHC